MICIQTEFSFLPSACASALSHPPHSNPPPNICLQKPSIFEIPSKKEKLFLRKLSREENYLFIFLSDTFFPKLIYSIRHLFTLFRCFLFRKEKEEEETVLFSLFFFIIIFFLHSFILFEITWPKTFASIFLKISESFFSPALHLSLNIS